MTYFFDQTQPMIKLDRDIIKTNILSMFEEDRIKIVDSRVQTLKLLKGDDDYNNDDDNRQRAFNIH